MLEKSGSLIHHPSSENLSSFRREKDGKGHSVPGKTPEMAYRTQEPVDVIEGFSGHHTRTGKAPVYPDFGSKNK